MSSRRTLFDPAFGFFVWAIHLLVVYSVAATACELLSGHGAARYGFSLKMFLIVATVIAATINAVHAAARYKSQIAVPDLRVRLIVTIGCDALATLAILWQLLVVTLVPACV